MTPAERLRAAAQLARETAEAATPGPWYVSPDDDHSTACTVRGEDSAAAWLVEPPDAAHIALCDPPFLLAAAALLEATADTLGSDDGRGEDATTEALALADDILQTTAVKP